MASNVAEPPHQAQNSAKMDTGAQPDLNEALAKAKEHNLYHNIETAEIHREAQGDVKGDRAIDQKRIPLLGEWLKESAQGANTRRFIKMQTMEEKGDILGLTGMFVYDKIRTITDSKVLAESTKLLTQALRDMYELVSPPNKDSLVSMQDIFAFIDGVMEEYNKPDKSLLKKHATDIVSDNVAKYTGDTLPENTIAQKVIKQKVAHSLNEFSYEMTFAMERGEKERNTSVFDTNKNIHLTSKLFSKMVAEKVKDGELTLDDLNSKVKLIDLWNETYGSLGYDINVEQALGRNGYESLQLALNNQHFIEEKPEKAIEKLELERESTGARSAKEMDASETSR